MADPDIAPGVLQQYPHVIVTEPADMVDAVHGAIGDAEQAVGGAGPQQAFAVFEQGRRSAAGQTVPAIEHLHPALRIEADQAAGSLGHPQVAVAVFQQGFHALVQPPFGLAVADAPNPAVAGNPQAAVAGEQQAADRFGRQPGLPADILDSPCGQAIQPAAIADQQAAVGAGQERVGQCAAQRRGGAGLVQMPLPIEPE